MFKHILVPTDLTEKSRKALDIAVKMALHEARQVTLLHVVETIEDTLESDEFRDFYKRLAQRAERRMEKLIGSYQNVQVTIDKEVIYGKRVNEIITFAQGHGIDLIILSSHAVDPQNLSEGWGTISYKVGVLSRCPVMLVK